MTTTPLHTSSSPSACVAMNVPVTTETIPAAEVVDFTRAALERNRKRQNERDALRQPRRPEPPEAA